MEAGNQGRGQAEVNTQEGGSVVILKINKLELLI